MTQTAPDHSLHPWAGSFFASLKTNTFKQDITRYSANEVAKILGEAAIIWVNPSNVSLSTRFVRTRKPKHLGKLLDYLRITDSRMRSSFFNLFYRNQFVLDDSDFNEIHDFAQNYQFKNATDFVDHADDFRKTEQYRVIQTSIEENGFYKYKGFRICHVDEIPDFFADYWAKLQHSMATNGYDRTKAPDIGKGYINQNGQLIKGENARHRLAMAQLTGVKLFPIRIFGVSESWYRAEIGDKFDRQRLASCLKEFEKQHQ